MSLSFLVPAFLAGLLALGIPIFIHLSRRQAREPVQFPSLMFLRNIPQQTEERRQIHRWPLLLLRCLAILLLVLAFARPFLNREEAQAAAPTVGARELVVLVDRSYSMGVGDRWERAVEAGLDAINGMSGGDRGTLIFFDSGAEATTESTLDRGVLRGALQASEPGLGTTRYAPGLRYAARLLSASPLPRHELVMISDFQAAGWEADEGEMSSIRLPAGTVVTPISVADVDADYNVTVSDARLERGTVADRERVNITARLTSTGTAPATVPVSLQIDGRNVETTTASFGETNSTVVTFSPLTLPTTGSTRGTIRIGDDALAADNQLNFVVGADQRMGVLIVEGGSGNDGSSLYLGRALAIGDNPGFRTETRRPGQLDGFDLASTPVVILHQTGIPAGTAGDRLRRHVEQGGGLIMLLGDNQVGQWTDVLPSIPAAKSISSGTTIGFIDTGHPVFEVFAGARSGDFSSSRIYQYRPLPAGSFPRVLARYGDGGTALAEKPVGAGRLLVWTSVFERGWNDLAVQPIFLPFLHQLVKYAAGYKSPASWMTIGQPFDPASLGPAAEAFDLALTPSGQRVQLDNEARIRFDETGFYELRNSRDDDVMTFAVNVDPLEAEPTTFDPEELRLALMAATAGASASGGDMELTIAERERQQNGWWYLVVLAFAMLVAETLLSNRYGVRGGATAGLFSFARLRGQAKQ